MLDVAQIEATRREEIRRVLDRHSGLFAGKDLLEIGSGTGLQLQVLQQVCRSAAGLEISGSEYLHHRLTGIHEYDGRTLPFPGQSFDIVFSSHVLEHIKDQKRMQDEIRRVLRPDGVAVHVVPTHSWRLWNSIIHYPALPRHLLGKLRSRTRESSSPSPGQRPFFGARILNLLSPPRHGEFGNRVSEHWLLHPAQWRKRLQQHGWQVEAVDGLGLAYTGHSFLGARVSMRARSKLARMLGSSSVVIVLRLSRFRTERCTAQVTARG